MFKTLVRFALPLALVLPASAGTLTVGPKGSGATFQTIADAIAAAQAGDVILVEPGFYKSTGPLIIDKPLSILGAGSGLVFREAQGGAVTNPLSLRIENLAAGEEVRVAGLYLTQVPAGYWGDHWANASSVVISNCLGPVVLADCVASVLGDFGTEPGVVSVFNSAQVSLDHCDFRGVPYAYVQPPFDGTLVGLYCEGSYVFVNDSVLMGSTGRSQGSQYFSQESGGAALHAMNSTVQLATSTLRGGSGGYGYGGSGAGVGGPALGGWASTLFVRGGSGNSLVGGNGGAGSFFGMSYDGLGGAGIWGDLTTSVTTTSDVVLIAGLDGGGQASTPPAVINGVHTALPFARATLRLSGTPAVLGASLGLAFGGEPGATALGLFSFGQAAVSEDPLIAGPAVLDLLALGALPPIQLDAQGALQSSVSVPLWPSLVGTSLIIQALALSPGGDWSLSGPAVAWIE